MSEGLEHRKSKLVEEPDTADASREVELIVTPEATHSGKGTTETEVASRESDAQLEKIDEVFLHYSKRILAFLIDFCLAGFSSLGVVFLIPPLMFSFDLLWTAAGGSPGKKRLSLRVTDADGHKLSEVRIFARTVLKFVFILTALYGWLIAHAPLWLLLLVTYQRRTIYDWLAGSYVRGKEKDTSSAFCPRPNYFLFLVLVGLAISTTYFRFAVGHKLLGIVEPLVPGILFPVRKTLASMELHSIDLNRSKPNDYAPIDRVAELQEILAPSGVLSLPRLGTLLRGYDTAREFNNEQREKEYAEKILQYKISDIEKAMAQNNSVVFAVRDRAFVRLYSNVGRVEEGATILEKMIQSKQDQTYQGEYFNHLINKLYRGVEWRSDAVRLRALLISKYEEADYRGNRFDALSTCAQQIYDLRALGRQAEADKLERKIKAIDEKLRAEHEQNRMNSL